MTKFRDSVKVSKATVCTTCQTYVYEFAFPIEKDIANFLLGLGSLTYNLDKYKLISIDNEYLYISGLIGRNSIKVKYKTNAETYKSLVELQLAAYLELVSGVKIELD